MGLRFLRHATAVSVPVGWFVSSTDGKTLIPSTSLTRSAIDCGVIKGVTGTAMTISTSSGPNTLAAIANNPGYFALALTTGNVDTVGSLQLTFNSTQKWLPFREDFWVIEEAVFDALYASGGNVAPSSDIATKVHTQAMLGTKTLTNLVEIIVSKLVGLCTGGGTTQLSYRNLGNTADVIVEAVTSVGNRTGVTLTPSA